MKNIFFFDRINSFLWLKDRLDLEKDWIDLFQRSVWSFWSRSIFFKDRHDRLDHGWSFSKIKKINLITVDLFQRSLRYIRSQSTFYKDRNDQKIKKIKRSNSQPWNFATNSRFCRTVEHNSLRLPHLSLSFPCIYSTSYFSSHLPFSLNPSSLLPFSFLVLFPLLFLFFLFLSTVFPSSFLPNSPSLLALLHFSNLSSHLPTL